MKLLEQDGKASAMWCSETGASNEVREILTLRARKPVKAGALFKTKKSILPGEKIVMVVTSGNQSEANSRFSGNDCATASRSRSGSRGDQVSARAAGGARAAGSAAGRASAGIESSVSESLEAHFRGGLSASIGHSFLNWLIGGPTADLRAELTADAREALEVGAKAAASATAGVGATLALAFACNFVGAVASSWLHSSSSTQDVDSVRNHIHRMTNGTQETKVMDNSCFRSNLFINQLFLWVEFDDGTVDEMGTLLMEASRDVQPPVPDAKLLEQFGLFSSCLAAS